MARAKARYEITAEDKTKRALDSARDNISALDRAMGSLARRALSIGGGVLGGVLTGGLATIATRAEEVASKMGNLADQVGTSASEMQSLGFLATTAGLSVEEMAKAVQNLDRRAEEARTGSKALAEAFGALGIDVERFVGLGAEDKMIAFADGIARLDTNGERARRSMQLLEEGGAKLLRIFRQGGDAVAATLEQGRAFGAVADEADLRRLQETGTGLATIGARLDGISVSLAGPVVRGFDAALEAASRLTLRLGGVDPDAFRDVGRSADTAARRVDWLADRLEHAGQRMQGAFVIEGFVPPERIALEAAAVENLIAQMDGVLARQEEAVRQRDRLLGRGAEVERALTSFDGVNTTARERLEAANRAPAGPAVAELRGELGKLSAALAARRTDELLERIADAVESGAGRLAFN